MRAGSWAISRTLKCLLRGHGAAHLQIRVLLPLEIFKLRLYEYFHQFPEMCGPQFLIVIVVHGDEDHVLLLHSLDEQLQVILNCARAI